MYKNRGELSCSKEGVYNADEFWQAGRQGGRQIGRQADGQAGRQARRECVSTHTREIVQSRPHLCRRGEGARAKH
jgi:hypothetical protein